MRIKTTIVAYAFSVQHFENATIVAYAGLRVKCSNYIVKYIFGFIGSFLFTFSLHCMFMVPELMVMASHQIFSGQIKCMSGQMKFGQTNFLYK